MKKVKLSLDALSVESFAVTAERGGGTVGALSETETRIGRTECRACPSDGGTCWNQETCGGYCTDYYPSCASGCLECTG
jgi:hypothetical protein